ncbi:MAG: EamA family transporter RarD [Pirellula sp.]
MSYLQAVLAYVLWGIFPLYWKLLPRENSFEIICHRIAWSLLTLVICISIVRQWKDVGAVLRDKKRLGLCCIAACLISTNWFVFIWAVQQKYVIESSLGYFINPMFNVVLGVILFKERLHPLQWLSVAIAATGLLVMTAGNDGFPWLAVTLATSFAFYAAVKKKTTLPAIAGLGMETAILLPIALAAIAYFSYTSPQAANRTSTEWGLLLFGGPITTIPLVLFAAAAKKVPMAAMGMLQYIAPSLQFAFGVFLFHEVVSTQRLIGFGIVWLALVVFTGYLIASARYQKKLT